MVKSIVIGSIFAIGVTSALQAETHVALGNLSFDMEVENCAVGDGHYLIDAAGEKSSLNVAASEDYTAIDLYYIVDDKNLRAGESVDFIELKDGQFVFSGDVSVSDETTKTLKLVVDAC